MPRAITISDDDDVSQGSVTSTPRRTPRRKPPVYYGQSKNGGDSPANFLRSSWSRIRVNPAPSSIKRTPGCGPPADTAPAKKSATGKRKRAKAVDIKPMVLKAAPETEYENCQKETLDPDAASQENTEFWELMVLPRVVRQAGLEFLAPHPIRPVMWDKLPIGQLLVQDSNCLSVTYTYFPFCRACTMRRFSVQSCQFVGFRIFQCRGKKNTIVYGPSFMSQPVERPDPSTGRCFVNRKWPPPHNGENDRLGLIRLQLYPEELYIMRLMIPNLLQLVNLELVLIRQCPKPYYSRNIVEGRQSCLVCRAPIFNSHWFCAVSACELCHNCYQAWTSSYNPNANGAPSLPFKLSKMYSRCKYNRQINCTYYHHPNQMVLVGRIPESKLLLLRQALLHYERKLVNLVPLDLPAPIPVPKYRYHLRPNRRRHERGLSLPEFQTLWRHGEVVIVAGIGAKLNLDWTPTAWAQHFHKVNITAVSHWTGVNSRITLRRLLKRMALYAQPKEKPTGREIPIEDDPDTAAVQPVLPPIRSLTSSSKSATTGSTPVSYRPSTSAVPSSAPRYVPSTPQTPETRLKYSRWHNESHFEQLSSYFEELELALPVREYTQDSGECNLNSRFPFGFDQPEYQHHITLTEGVPCDLSSEARQPGAINLRMSLTDSVTVLVYGGPIQEATEAPTSAVWTVFHAEDREKLTDFVRQQLGPSHKSPSTTTASPTEPADANDPFLHPTESVYLNKTQCKRLFINRGVRYWSFGQNPGDAVFIPAGYFYQVRAYVPSIFVTKEFVSSEHVGRSIALSQEIHQNPRAPLPSPQQHLLFPYANILYYAWLDARDVVEERLPAWNYELDQADRKDDDGDLGDDEHEETIPRGPAPPTPLPLVTTNSPPQQAPDASSSPAPLPISPASSSSLSYSTTTSIHSPPFSATFELSPPATSTQRRLSSASDPGSYQATSWTGLDQPLLRRKSLPGHSREYIEYHEVSIDDPSVLLIVETTEATEAPAAAQTEPRETVNLSDNELAPLAVHALLAELDTTETEGDADAGDDVMSSSTLSDIDSDTALNLHSRRNYSSQRQGHYPDACLSPSPSPHLLSKGDYLQPPSLMLTPTSICMPPPPGLSSATNRQLFPKTTSMGSEHYSHHVISSPLFANNESNNRSHAELLALSTMGTDMFIEYPLKFGTTSKPRPFRPPSPLKILPRVPASPPFIFKTIGNQLYDSDSFSLFEDDCSD